MATHRGGAERLQLGYSKLRQRDVPDFSRFEWSIPLDDTGGKRTPVDHFARTLNPTRRRKIGLLCI
jgi:hypothetical protein